MTPEILQRLQAACREKYASGQPVERVPIKEKKVYKKKEEEKVVEVLKEVGIEFVKAADYTPKLVIEKPVIDFKKVNQHANGIVGKPKYDKSDTHRVPIPEKKVEKFTRPPAIYDNQKSLYGINYDDL